MNKYIKNYSESINESILHNGIVLIKGKPKGRNGEQFLFAGHVIGSAEVRPGAIMLFLSSTFYRVILEEGRLKGVKISYQSEESLKDALNFKSPGRISVVKNNNKTPFHWRTLKYTTIHEALAAVSYDILGGGYIFESANTDPLDAFGKVLIRETVDSIFFNNTNDCIVLKVDTPNDVLLNAIDEGDDTTVTVEDWSVTIDVLNISKNHADSEFNSEIPRRYKIELTCTSDAEYTVDYEAPSYENPGHSEVSIDSVDTRVTLVTLLTSDDVIELDDEDFLDKLTDKVSSFDETDFALLFIKLGKFLKL
jgi:hypothetical protein